METFFRHVNNPNSLQHILLNFLEQVMREICSFEADIVWCANFRFRLHRALSFPRVRFCQMAHPSLLSRHSSSPFWMASMNADQGTEDQFKSLGCGKKDPVAGLEETQAYVELEPRRSVK
jgi:hypothetical protein